MLRTTEQLIDLGYQDRILTDNDLQYLFGGTAARRYALVNKALKKHELIRLRRGLYTLDIKYHREKLSQLVISNHLVPLSYVSLESALAFYNWIPERVMSITSVHTTKRKKSFTTFLGEFIYYSIPINPDAFFVGVIRQEVGKEAFFVASPLRALADYVYIRKVVQPNLDYLQNSLRIELEQLKTLKLVDFAQLKNVYRSKRIFAFLDSLEKELNL
jgi:predicted transcriptional regulator of viral defense system